MRQSCLALVRCIKRCQPKVVLGEQVWGLATHRRLSLWLMLLILGRVPYRWYLLKLNARALGGCHCRVRLAIVGVREDCHA